jgi:hypothetical protein
LDFVIFAFAESRDFVCGPQQLAALGAFARVQQRNGRVRIAAHLPGCPPTDYKICHVADVVLILGS